MHNTAIVPGSIGAIAKSNRTSIAETFANADVVIIVDTSGSMHTTPSELLKTLKYLKLLKFIP